MSRKATIFTGQWADLPLNVLAPKMAALGYDGLELATWGDHLNLDRADIDQDYCDERIAYLKSLNLGVWAISAHCAGQLTCDLNNDSRSDGFAPVACRGDAEAKRAWGIEQMKKSARVARRLGVNVVNGFTGSPIWHAIYNFPGISEQAIDDGFKRFAEIWHPILDEFDANGVKFALEVHPTEIAFDIVTAQRALDAIGHREAFGFNFDPSHLYWQMVDPVRFIERFPDRIYHVHVKDAVHTLDGTSSILCSHLGFGQAGRGWDFRSPGHGQINFEEIIRALNRINYTGPLSVEWEDCGMEREYGAKDALAYLRKIDFYPSSFAFDDGSKTSH